MWYFFFFSKSWMWNILFLNTYIPTYCLPNHTKVLVVFFYQQNEDVLWKFPGHKICISMYNVG